MGIRESATDGKTAISLCHACRLALGLPGVLLGLKKQLRLHCCWIILVAFATGCATTAINAEVSGGNAAKTGSAARDGNQPHAISGPTTSELFLCIGPAPACPSTGTVNPPPAFQPMLAMQFGQTWNGTMDAYANDGSAITGTISLVDVYNGGPPQTYCTVAVAVGGVCSASVGTTVGTAVGTHLLTAMYSGDATHQPSTSAAVTIVVSQETTTATLTGTPNPALFGQPVTLTATVGGTYATPTGTVTFLSGGAVIGTATLAAGSGTVGLAGTATIATSTLPVGQDTITAVYASTTNFTSATATWIETVTPAPAGSFTVTVTPDPAAIGVGRSATLDVTVSPQNGFAQDVTLSCSNLPQEATCAFATPTIAGGSGTTAVIIQTTAPHTCGTSTPYFLGGNSSAGFGDWFSRHGSPAALPAIAGIFAFLVPLRRRRCVKLLIALVAIASTMQITGCGNCTDLGTRPATYTIEVTGTAADSSTAVSQAVTLTVTI